MTTNPKVPQLSDANSARLPMQWEVWQVQQSASRAATHPPVPPDPRKSERPFLVISPDTYNKGHQEVVCLPISGQKFVHTFEVELNSKFVSGLTKLSFVKCYKPVTIDVKYLSDFRGKLTNIDKINEIKETFKDFFDF